ncbi:dTDP-4-dehydrorhamnose reductase [Streptomonospora sediminis]
MPDWLVTGAGGMLARDLLACLADRGEDAVGLTRRELDVTDRAAVRRTLRCLRPATVVNCAAWTAVDDAEAAEDAALRTNGAAVGNVARGCAEIGARLLHLSTDYVFSGDADTPYPEDAAPAPRTAYGRTKLAGEREVRAALPAGSGLIVRTSWLYGAHGRSFVRTMIRLAGEREYVDVVDDQWGQPTWTADVAQRLAELGSAPAAGGVYHATSSGEATWLQFGREVFKLLGADPERVRPVPSAAFPRPAARPAYSALGHGAWQAAGLRPIRNWRSALAEAFPHLVR